MITYIVDEQTSYFWDLVIKNNLQQYFYSEFPAENVQIAIIKTVSTVNKEFIDKYPHLKMIIRAGSGYDNIDLKLTANRNIIVCNTPNANTQAAYEHTLSLIFALLKKHLQSKSNIIKGLWKEHLDYCREINELRVMVVGVGRIGTKVAQTLKDFNADVIGVDPYLSNQQWKEKGIKPTTFSEGLKSADMITFHCPLTEETRDYFSQNTLQQVTKPVLIVNTARGGIVNEKALQQGLETGIIAGAGIDVFDNEPYPDLPFARFENVYLTPHTGAYSLAAKKRLAEEVLDVWNNYVFKNHILNQVNN